MTEELVLIEREKMIERLLLAQTITQIDNRQARSQSAYPSPSELALGLIECFHDLETATYLPLIEDRIGRAFAQLYTLSRLSQTKIQFNYRYVDGLSVSQALGRLVKNLRNEASIDQPLHHLFYALWAMSESQFDLSFPETIYNYAKSLAPTTELQPALG
ncbi:MULTISPECIES: hypothetical protein [Aerococcus]|uniref:Uncharacterized protein n=1 Tax=Aerococcus sanguinicola TaxID=119206 RepID=A0A5N1GKD4_9LACT|nr:MULTISPECIES: hypothetical protein [Aerococcus]KAA9300766.1 hypothetical protein F6I03_05525 [Aerococcus sanguinicola]MDK6369449.1 hypothetical protein [Aerococcus sp. UMB9870]MDK6680512.1 hypothetical protein [Aerococcus sp. UMB8608]MDK6686688.1 hypothetical protein [Aerococcus sp. UMB8623]MDK6940459.1 hypothetical protein [Aerococcus sp. UMB8487]